VTHQAITATSPGRPDHVWVSVRYRSFLCFLLISAIQIVCPWECVDYGSHDFGVRVGGGGRLGEGGGRGRWKDFVASFGTAVGGAELAKAWVKATGFINIKD